VPQVQPHFMASADFRALFMEPISKGQQPGADNEQCRTMAEQLGLLQQLTEVGYILQQCLSVQTWVAAGSVSRTACALKAALPGAADFRVLSADSEQRTMAEQLGVLQQLTAVRLV
jgi:hypothetical protein